MDKFEKLEFPRFVEKINVWKKMTVDFTDDGAFITLEEGVKGEDFPTKRIVFKLNKNEIASLIMSFLKAYFFQIK